MKEENLFIIVTASAEHFGKLDVSMRDGAQEAGPPALCIVLDSIEYFASRVNTMPEKAITRNECGRY
jgi:hypothetical protein